MTYFISRVIYGIILKLFFKFEVMGKNNLPARGAFIAVANHASYADPVVMAVACNTTQLKFVAKRELFGRPFLGPWCKATGCIPIERYSGSSAPLKKALKILKEGGALGIFPEGKRSPDGSLQKAEPGVGVIAARSKAPIVPMYISGADKAMPKGTKIPRPRRITVRIGRIVDISGYEDIPDRRRSYEFIGEKIMASIAGLKHA